MRLKKKAEQGKEHIAHNHRKTICLEISNFKDYSILFLNETELNLSTPNDHENIDKNTPAVITFRKKT